MHGAVTTDQYMILVGGIGQSGNTISQLYLYDYTCRRWTDVAHFVSGKSSRWCH